MKKIVATDKAPAAVGPYSQAIVLDEHRIITSGQIPLDPATGELVSGGIEEQTRQVFANLKAVLEEGGFTLDDVVKTTCFMADMGDFAKMNAVYAEYFTEGSYPARSAFQVGALPKGAQIEIEVIASK